MTTTTATQAQAFTVKNSMPKNILAAFLTIPNGRRLVIGENVLIEIEPQNIRFTVTDVHGTFAIWDERRHDINGNTFAFCVDPKFLTQIATIQDVEYSAEEQSVMVNGFTFATTSADDFPAVPEIPTTQNHYLPVSRLQHLSQFVTKDEMRPAMTGINVGPELCASDGHRLITAQGIECDPFILPVRRFLAKLKGDVIIQEPAANKYARIYTERCDFLIRVIDAPYPDFKAVIPSPEQTKYFVSCDSEALYNSIVKILPAANKVTQQIFFDILQSTVKLTAQDIDMGTQAKTYIDRHTNREYTRIAFNGKYLASMLKGQKGNFTLKFNAETKPFIWQAGDFFNLIMPVIAYNDAGETEGPSIDVIMPAAYHTAITEGIHAGLTETDAEEIARKTGGLTLIRWEETHPGAYDRQPRNIYTFHNPMYQA